MAIALQYRPQMATDHAITALYQYLGRQVSARRRGRYTQTQLAKAIGVSRTSVTNLERGRQRIPVHYLLHIAEALDCELSDLLPTRSILSVRREAEAIDVVGTLTPAVRAVLQRYAKEGPEKT
jgi:transcriptional regulator with XRE-family HTH domain